MPGRFASTFCNPLSFPQITEQKRRLAAVDCYAVHGGCFFPGMDLSALKIYDIIASNGTFEALEKCLSARYASCRKAATPSII